MLTTFDRSFWVENPEDVKLRENFDTHSDPAVVRKQYPLMARAKKRLIAYGIEEGTTFKYARTRNDPNFYPIEALLGVGDGPHVRRVYLASEEVLLLEL